MEKFYKSVIFVFFMFAATSAFAGYDSKCLSDCFSTHHECSYCAYQCQATDKVVSFAPPTSEYKCPFTE